MMQSRFLAGLLTATLALSSCDQLNLDRVKVQDRTVTLGLSAQQTINVPYGGTWRVTSVPSWLQVYPQSGRGPINLNVAARRQDGTPVTADQPTLRGEIHIAWVSGTGTHATRGTAEWTITAEQYELTGRLVQPAQVNGQDMTPTASLNSDQSASAPRGVIVKYRSQPGSLTAQAARAAASRAAALGRERLQAAGIGVTRHVSLGKQGAAFDVKDIPAALEVLRRDPNVEYAVPNAVLRVQALAQPVVPTDQFAPLQWAYPLLGYGAVWRDMESGSYTNAVTVAVLDTGVRFDHPDLEGKLWLKGEGAMDVIASTDNGDGDGADTDPTDPSVPGRRNGSHGTHVTGIIAARWGTNSAACDGCSPSGVVGASYKANVKVLPVRVIDAYGEAAESDVILGIQYAAGIPVTIGEVEYLNPQPAQVINLSLGGAMSASAAQPMCDAIAQARAKGVLVIAAAGNGFGTVPYYPAACDGAVSVGSVTLSGASAPMHAPYSNAYPQVQLAAPGGAVPFGGATFNGGTFNGAAFEDLILSTSWNYTKNVPYYEAQAGTSQASPQVAALAALLLSKGITTGADDTLQRLRDTATDLGAEGRDELFGYGMINAAAALNAPQVSDGLGVRIQSSRGLSFQPALDSTGAFRAYLGEGSYRVTAGSDVNGNGVFGEVGETRDDRTAELSEQTPQVDLGALIPR